ncbi:MAG: hypothetical protein JW881_00265, partial [Spirochaetales bacterium]|nr:hypothetical protein [Spirochaetales bacterium]
HFSCSFFYLLPSCRQKRAGAGDGVKLTVTLFLLVLNSPDNRFVFWFAVSLGGYGVLSFVYYLGYLFSLKRKYAEGRQPETSL